MLSELFGWAEAEGAPNLQIGVNRQADGRAHLLPARAFSGALPRNIVIHEPADGLCRREGPSLAEKKRAT